MKGDSNGGSSFNIFFKNYEFGTFWQKWIKNQVAIDIFWWNETDWLESLKKMNLDLGVSEGQQNLFGKCILDFWMKFDKFSKGKEESLDHWIRPSFNLMSWLRPKHLFWFSNLRMKSQKLINWMIYMKSHLSDFTTDLHRSHVCNQWLRRKTYVTPRSRCS